MGTFIFNWDHPASEVYVTGTFDEWKKTVKLDKVGEHFEKEVKLSDASEKILYKFVVDGDWVTDHTAPKEADESGNENNVLTPDRIIKEAPTTAAIMNSVAPDSTTAALAAGALLEKEEKPAELPGAFPETPAAEIGISPMPAADGAVNPIKLAPGEKIPEGLTADNTSSNVKLDQESYEKADELPGGTTAILSSAAPDSTTAALAATVPIETSAAPDSTTAALTADAPIETKVPEVVKVSQEKADAAPEASAIPEEVQEKAAVETELLEKVKEAPSTSEGTAGQGTEKTENAVSPGEAAASVAAAVTAVGAAAIAGAVATKDAAVESVAAQIPDAVKEKLPESAQKAIDTSAKEQKIEEVSPEVPAEVKESILEAGKAPEAAANTEAVEEKKAVETELLKEVKPVEAVGEESKAETTESKPAQIVEKVEETVGVASKTEPETTTAAETNGANGAQASNGAQTTGEASKPAEIAATTEKKKKNRLSTMFSKIKSKLNK